MLRWCFCQQVDQPSCIAAGGFSAPYHEEVTTRHERVAGIWAKVQRARATSGSVVLRVTV